MSAARLRQAQRLVRHAKTTLASDAFPIATTAPSTKIPSAARLRALRTAAREAGNLELAGACFRLLRAKTRRTSGPGLGNQAESIRRDVELVSAALAAVR